MSARHARRIPFLVALLSLPAMGCDLLRGPTPLNDPPVIESIGEFVFVNTQGDVVQTRAFIDLRVNDELRLPIEAIEPEGEELRLVVGPIPRGWRYDPGNRVLLAMPDHRQRDLVFTVYIAAEDSHSPPEYDVRVLEFSVR